MGQEQGKTTMSEPSFAENSAPHSLGIKNRFLLYENNYLRNVNNLLSEIREENHVKPQFAEPEGDHSADIRACQNMYAKNCGPDYKVGEQVMSSCMCGAWKAGEEPHIKSQADCEKVGTGCKYTEDNMCLCPRSSTN